MPNEDQKPVTRTELRAELKTFTAEVLEVMRENSQHLRTEMLEAMEQKNQQLRADMQEFVRDAQTEILRGFEAFEHNREIRFRRLKADVGNLDLEANGRVDNIEKRLMAIEKKLLLNPPPPPQ